MHAVKGSVPVSLLLKERKKKKRMLNATEIVAYFSFPFLLVLYTLFTYLKINLTNDLYLMHTTICE